MFSVFLAGFEAIVVVVGLALLYWWTNKQAEEANAAMPKHLTEQDYLVAMTKQADQAIKQNAINRSTLVSGVLSRDTTIQL